MAVAILADKKSPEELKQLKDVILQVHSELQKLSEEVRADRSKTKLKSKAASSDGSGSQGG